MLAAAAAREMAASGCITRLLRNLLGMLRSGGASSIFSAGGAGEFAAGVLLTSAYDRAVLQLVDAGVERASPGVPVPVGTFWGELVGAGATMPLPEEKARFGDTFVSALQVITANEVITREWLLHAFQRNLARQCRKNEYAVDFVIPIARVGSEQAKVHELGASSITAMLVQMRSRARGSLAPLSKVSIFSKSDDFALGLCGADTAYISILASVADRSAEGGGAPNCIYSENGKLRVLLSGISASQMPPSDDGAAEILRTIATGIFRAADQVALAVEERGDGGAAELSFLFHQPHVGGFSPDPAAADPTSHLRLPAAATKSTAAEGERARLTKRRRRGTRWSAPISTGKRRSDRSKG